MSSVLLAFGSNLGNKKANILKALELLSKHKSIDIIKTSSFFITEPMGKEDQPFFINSAALILTSNNPEQLLSIIKSIESEIGRKKREKWHEREIDIDIIFFDNLILNLEGLSIPHSEMHKRNFVLVPAAEIAPDLIHPIFEKSVLDIQRECKDNLKVVSA